MSGAFIDLCGGFGHGESGVRYHRAGLGEVLCVPVRPEAGVDERAWVGEWVRVRDGDERGCAGEWLTGCAVMARNTAVCW